MGNYRIGSGLENSSPNIYSSCALFFWSDFMNNKYMHLALKEAKKAYDVDEVPIGAVIVKNDEIIARAHNLKEQEQKITKHAELIAIEMASEKLSNWRLDDCDIYITLEPCPMCASAIQQARIKSVYYGTKCSNTEVTKIVDKILGVVDRNKAVTKVVDCNCLECKKMLQKYFKSKR